MNSPLFLIVFIVSALFFANPLLADEGTSGKVRSVLGEVTRQKKAQNQWLPLRVGAKVYESELIRTLVESQAIISLPDGSSLTIEENAIVVLEKVFSKKGSKETTLNIKSGLLHFDVQKQAGKTGSFKFKTGTATAAIRGTNGAIGIAKKGLFASLAEGALEVQDAQGNKILLKKGQTLVQDSAMGFIVIDNPLSGTSDFSKSLHIILNDPNSTKQITPELLDSLTTTFNSKIDSLLEKSKCQFNSVEDTLYSNEIKIQGRCIPGILLSIDGEQTAPTLDSIVEHTITWEQGLFGEKKYRIYCLDNQIQALCGEVQFVYADNSNVKKEAKNNFTIQNPGSIQVCESNSIQIEGTFEKASEDTELRIKMGKYISENLIPLHENDKFFHSITINDLNKNWNEKTIEVEMTNAKGLIKKETIALDINKTCKSVNVIAPKIKWLSSDSLRCHATLKITDANEDESLLSTYVNSNLTSESYYKGNQNKIQISLKPGIQDYRFKVQDLAKNQSEIKKTLGCFPKRQAQIQIYGGKSEVWRVPPPPKGASNILNKELRFSIKNIPENDTRYIQQILVKKNGRIILNLLKHQITDLNYNIPIEITRDSNNIFEIEVRLKSGNVNKATKTFEVR